MVRTFQACETIVQTATVTRDDDILRVTDAVNNDLVATEAIYHKACHATYISKNNLHYEGRQDTSYDIAFQQTAWIYVYWCGWGKGVWDVNGNREIQRLSEWTTHVSRELYN